MGSAGRLEEAARQASRPSDERSRRRRKGAGVPNEGSTRENSDNRDSHDELVEIFDMKLE